VRRNAVLTAVLTRDRNDDRLALRARQAALTAHQDIVIVHERAKVFGPLRICTEDVGYESDLRTVLRVNVGDVGR